MLSSKTIVIAFIAATGLSSVAEVHSQPLETETARTLPSGKVKLAGSFEFQTSAEGTEVAVPLELEYGITDNLQLLVEPVAYTSIHPKSGSGASGLGDLESTLLYRFIQESESLPAFALAGEVKIPIAKSTLISTGKADYTGYLIASKKFGSTDLHANIGYTIVGVPAGATLNNVLSGSAAFEYHLNSTFDVVGELFANTPSVPEGNELIGSTESTTTPEAAGGEVFGTIGARYYPQSNLAISFGLSYDNNKALLIRPGIALKL
jgi:hypothetical protein